MGLTAALIGGISGTGIHMMTNVMRKVPMSRSKFFFQEVKKKSREKYIC